ncbi:Store-operated calcium entry-associated regulatory factor [Podochytrium sp. JEL0797]|nr:Store-operated calcium entry-associated regulatory factor [Podochytrium sp. JEL0797]
MKCVGGDACSAVIDTMQCYNRGFDGRDVQWECRAELENFYKFGTTDVSCEGYSYADDKYVLAGSCGVEYTLFLTEKGKRFKNNKHSNAAGYQDDYDDYAPERTSTIVKSIWLVVAGIFLYSMYVSCLGAVAGGRRGGNNAPRGNNGGGGGGAGGGSGGGSCDPPMNSRTQGPGFWSGLGLGGLLGSMWNRPAYNSGWGNSAGYYGGPSMRARAGPSFRAPQRSSGSSSSAGPSTRTSSGFGGSRRR